VKRQCDCCPRLLMEIDYYGQRLIGCTECNRWGLPDDKRLIMEMPDGDLKAIEEARQSGGATQIMTPAYRMMFSVYR
jgi:hypothetical protein